MIARRLTVSLGAAALVGAMLPVTLGGTATATEEGGETPTESTETPAPTEPTEPAETPAPTEAPDSGSTSPFAGYSASAWATPLQVEIFEPTIPIPATPQAELEFGFSEVEADSTATRGRASYVWPGAPVGEGFKTILEGLGLPPGVGADGYPVQVNSAFPNGPEFESDEPFPGAVQRTGSGDRTAYAENGFSSDGQAQDRGGEPSRGGGGGLPGLPELPAPGLTAGLSTLGDLFGGKTAASPGKSTGKRRGVRPSGKSGRLTPATHETLGKAPEGAPNGPLPPGLDTLIDIGGYTSVSRTDGTGNASATSRAALGDVSLLGGLITLEGLRAKSVSTSDGVKGVGAGEAEFGQLTVLGQKFAYGPDGFEAVGQSLPIPGLPDQVPAALEQLGITLVVPSPTYDKDGDAVTTTVSALIVEVDLLKLRSRLDALPLNRLIDMIPAEAGQLKSLLQAGANLTTRIVVTLATAVSKVDTVQPIDIPLPEDPGAEDPDAGDAAGTGGAGSAGAGAAGGAGSPPGSGGDAAAAGDAAGGDAAALTDAAPAGAGLPPLFSIPGILLVGGFALAAVAGSYFRKIGALALGAGSVCPHGLDSGLPDLRKA